MPQRQQMPYNWGIPPSQMGQFQRPPHNPMMNRPMNQMGRMGQMGQMGRMGRMGQMQSFQGRQGGGFLSKLLGKGKTASGGGLLGMNPIAGGGAAPGGSFLKSFTNPTAISGFLNNTQQVLRAAQQIGPMVSQYGPLMRNLPAMWRLYRGLKDGTVENAEDQDDQSTESKGEDTPLSSAKNNKVKATKEDSRQSIRKNKPLTTNDNEKGDFSVSTTNVEQTKENRSRKRRTNETEARQHRVKITDKSPGLISNKKSKDHSNDYDWDDESEDKPIQKGSSIPRLYI